MQTVIKYLEKLGFSHSEAKLYITLLQLGPVPVKDLARKAKINRTASYTSIASLLEKGFLTEITKGQRKLFKAVDPYQINSLIEDKLSDIKELEQQFPSILRTIDRTLARPSREDRIDTQYYQGEKGVLAICNDAFNAKEIRCYAKLTEIAPGFLDNNKDIFEKALAKNRHLKIYEIIADSPEASKKFELIKTARTGRYFYKYASTKMELNASTLIYDNKVAIMNINKYDEISGVVLHNVDYFNNSKKIFDFMWNTLPSIIG